MNIFSIEQPSKCGRVYFRGYSSLHLGKDNNVSRMEGVRFLKRKSCKGDHEGPCDLELLNQLNDSIFSNTLILPEIEDRAIYSLRITNIKKDYESGIVDDWDLEFYKVADNDEEFETMRNVVFDPKEIENVVNDAFKQEIGDNKSNYPIKEIYLIISDLMNGGLSARAFKSQQAAERALKDIIESSLYSREQREEATIYGNVINIGDDNYTLTDCTIPKNE